MGTVEDIGPWRARRAQRAQRAQGAQSAERAQQELWEQRAEPAAAVQDISMGAPPFVLEEPCPGCGAERVSEMVWRLEPGKNPLPLPRIAPHFLCQDDVVVFQDVTDSPEPV